MGPSKRRLAQSLVSHLKMLFSQLAHLVGTVPQYNLKQIKPQDLLQESKHTYRTEAALGLWLSSMQTSLLVAAAAGGAVVLTGIIGLAFWFYKRSSASVTPR